MAGVDVVVGQRLVHVLVDVQPVQEHGGVLVAHQVPGEPLLPDGLLLDQLGVSLVPVDDLHHPGLVVVGVKDLVKSGVSLFLVEKVDKFGTLDHILPTTVDGSEEFVNIVSRTDGLVYFVKLLKTERLDVNEVRFPVGKTYIS